MSLTKEELLEKIKVVEADLQKLRSDGADARKLEVLGDYKVYLQDEIKMLENDNRSRTRTR
jgi:hypothetical protein